MLSPHPLAELFPAMADEAFDQLVADIRANGLREAIILHEGMILDGRNRHRACTVIGIEPITRVWDERGSPLDFVVSKNLHRRHLSDQQRAMVAAKIATMKREDTLKKGTHIPDPPIGGSEDHPIISQNQAAAMLNVSSRSVQRARAVQSNGVSELKKAVEKGDVSLKAAEEIARKPQEEQREIMSQGSAAILKAAKESRETRPHKRPANYDPNAKRAETKRIKAELYRQLRDAVELLCGLPDPAEVANIVAGIPSSSAFIGARLPQALTWLERFNREHSNRRQDSSAA